ncbi:S8 family peptidase [Streptomyces sp. SID13726]|uniref:S8 family peptidase n=1 Tax=Streptomyces sp. SID13726 TaxID=2706058 RepID=UPI0013BD65A4|nr:S8 family peptidase [Streptomyces sp. SID13726]NEA99041.1 S8 family peptidase [Streptomyces sp. SID13726]
MRDRSMHRPPSGKRIRQRLPGRVPVVTYGTAALLAVAGLAGTAVPSTAAPSTAPTSTATSSPPTGSAVGVSHVTLITGDTVGVDRAGRIVDVRRGEGRGRIGYRTQVAGGHTLVVPADAITLLNSGRLDRRLFDITRLMADGYDDEHRAGLPLIVSYRGDRSRRAGAERTLKAADAQVRRELPAVHGQLLVADKKDTAELWRALTAPGTRSANSLTTAPGVDRVWLDGKVEADPRAAEGPPGDDTGTVQIGAPDAWKAGWDGKGVKVAVLDTGVDPTHPDLKDRIAGSQNFTDFPDTDDHFGHGTHVASTIVGSGAASDGRYTGVAPGARLLNGKVLGDDGSGSESGIIAGMQWAVDQGAKVVNMSLGGTDAYGSDPMEQAVNSLSASKGVLFAVAAGNEGPAEQTVGTPGSAAAALTVAAVDRKDVLAPFSSRGPTADDRLKPDISAPGVDIVAAKAEHGTIGEDAGTAGYVRMSGTSMATPHVAGAAAVLAQEHPDWSGERIKAALMGSARSGAGLTAYEQGSGRVDLTHAITEAVVADPPSLDFGTQLWPHDDDTPVTRTLTYRNTGAAPVTLSLTAAGTAGMFTVSPATLTVPAGGTATATATADTRTAGPDGVHSGAVTAASADGHTVLRTPALVVREVESYDLTVKTVGLDGRPPAVALVAVVPKSAAKLRFPYDRDTDGDYQVTVRLPKGRYLMDDFIWDGQEKYSMQVAPEVNLTKDTSLVFDQRKGKKVTITAPAPEVSGDYPLVRFATNGSKRAYDYGIAASLTGTTLAQVGPSAPQDSFMAQVTGVRAAPGAGKPQYHIVVGRKGSFFNGLVHTVRPSSLAKLDLAIGSTVKSTEAVPGGQWETPGFPQLTGIDTGTLGTRIPAPTGHAAVYVSADQGLRWNMSLSLYRPGGPYAYSVTNSVNATGYKSGRTYRETYNKAVFGPQVSGGTNWIGGYRSGDNYALCNSLLSDGRYVYPLEGEQTAKLTAGGRTYLDVPRDPCDYGVLTGLPEEKTEFTLTNETRRSLRDYKVSDRVTATWTFTSQHVDTAGPAQPLPLSVVRFAPELSLTATAKAGRKTVVPVTVHGPAAAKGHLKSLSVRVSYDGGRTWHPVTVHTGASGKRSITLTPPATPGTVSFQAALSDTEGNTYSGTIDNAYLTVR